MSRLYVIARKLPRLHYGMVLVALSKMEVMARQPPGSVQTECVRLPYAAPPFFCVAFFVKVQPCGLRGSVKRGKGKSLHWTGPCRQVMTTME